jgi:hypothetical protein
MKDKLALDKSARNVDKDGMLHVAKCRISKATVNPYYGKEIPNWQELGLSADKVYQLLRPADELLKAASTFAGKPILSKHIRVTSEELPVELIVGTIGSNVEFNEPYLEANLSFWRNDAIVGIETEEIKELSCSYYYDAVMEPGVFGEVPYDGRMTNLVGNHLAQVKVGRAGSDVIVSDSKPVTMIRKDAMKKSKLGIALIAALGALSPKLAADEALPQLVGLASKKTFNKKETLKKLQAMDADLDSNILEEIVEAIVELQTDEVATDDTPDGKVRSLLGGKVDEETIAAILALLTPVASDEYDEDEKVKKEDVKAAMDSMRDSMLQAEDARRTVRPVVGDVDLAMDAAAVYEFALKQMKVDHEGVKDPVALKALFKVAHSQTQSKQVVAKDSASVVKLPSIKHMKQG